jgi:hypothetical protein
LVIVGMRKVLSFCGSTVFGFRGSSWLSSSTSD